MQWIALGYGLALGVAQFFVLRAIWLRSLAPQPGPAGPLLAGGGAYAAAAVAAIYIFSEQLGWAGGGMLGRLCLLPITVYKETLPTRQKPWKMRRRKGEFPWKKTN